MLLNMATKLLIIEDDPDVVDLLVLNFVKAGGFEILSALDGETGLQKACDELPGAIILDLALPKMSGLEICRILKTKATTKHIPIAILTAKVDLIDRIVGLEMGADDYVTKPFSPREVVLRVTALLRRAIRDPQEERLRIGAITIDPSRHSVTACGKTVRLTLAEFKLLRHLMHRSGIVEARDRLLTEVWGYDNAVKTRTVDTHIQRLRRKLGKAAGPIETVRGFGYRFREE
jgi:DNA-binding response OmpR family regulator